MKKLRNFLIVLIAILMCSFNVAFAYSEGLSNKTNQILESSIVLKIRSNVAYVNGELKNIDQNPKIVPIIKDSRTLLPVRFISESLGASVAWDEASKTATITKDDKIIKYILDKKEMYINDVSYPIDVAPQRINASVYVPVANLAQSLGQQSFWDPKGIVILSEQKIDFREDALLEMTNGDPVAVIDENALNQKMQWIQNQVVAELDSQFPDSSIVPEEKPPVIVPPVDYDALVTSGAVIGKTNKNASYYTSYDLKTKKGTIPSGTQVEIIRDKSLNVSSKVYQVKSLDGKYSGWTSSSNVSVPSTPATRKDVMTQEQIEGYINSKGLTSSTNYLMWVDLNRQLTHVFIKDNGRWKLVKTMTCASGKNTSPTIRGTFKISAKGNWMDTSPKGDNVGVMNWTQFYGDYLFHSVIVDSSGNVRDNTQSKKVSHGCIRLTLEDSQWVQDYVPVGTTVYIY